MTAASVVLPGAYATPRALFLFGALLFPPFLMQQDVVVRAGLIGLFMLLDVLSGRRVRLLQFVVVSAGIVLFNLVIPTGKVLAAPLGLAITEGALKSGLMKATAMTGLIMLSRFSIRRDLRLPGRAGGLIGRSLFYFEAIMNERNRIDRRNIIGSIDAILLSVMHADTTVSPGRAENPVPRDGVAAGERLPARKPAARMNARGLAALAVIVAINWGILVLTLLHPPPFWGG